MEKTPHFTLHELVTSNTARGLGDLRQLPVSGKEFLAPEPYGSGTAPVITRLPDEDGHRRLALAYPAEHTQLALTLDEDGRILHETLTAPTTSSRAPSSTPSPTRTAVTTERPGGADSAHQKRLTSSVVGSRRQHSTCAAWWTTRIAALCPALVALLAALVLCLGYVPHGHSDPVGAPLATRSVTVGPPSATAKEHAAQAAHPANCPSGDVCCGPAANGVRAVLAAPAHPLQAVLPRTPKLHKADTASAAAPGAPTCRAPDLHVLQVQRI